MIRAKKLRPNSKIQEYKNLDVFLSNIYGQGFGRVNNSDYNKLARIAERDDIIYYCTNPYKAEIDLRKEIIFGDNEETLDSQRDLLSEEI